MHDQRRKPAAFAPPRDIVHRDARLVCIEQQSIEVPRDTDIECDAVTDRRIEDLAPIIVLSGAHADRRDERRHARSPAPAARRIVGKAGGAIRGRNDRCERRCRRYIERDTARHMWPPPRLAFVVGAERIAAIWIIALRFPRAGIWLVISRVGARTDREYREEGDDREDEQAHRDTTVVA